MSVYTDCAEAAQSLLDNPKLADPKAHHGVAGIFTEMDVIVLAARIGGWSEQPAADREAKMRLAQREASQVMGALFRTRKAVRFGPVQIPGLDEPDYMRLATKIVYSGAKGPEAIETPNGTFERLQVHDDPITRQGRRLGTNRNDLVPWSEQTIAKPPVRAIPATAEGREIARLKAEVEELRRRLDAAQAENHRLREHRAGSSDDEIARIVKATLAEVNAA